MTDTIGWGDVDVDVEAPRRRRLPRFPRRVAWPVAVVVVGGLVLTPRIESRLADDSAAWLQRQWALAAAYDDAREPVEARAAERAAEADRHLFAAVVSAVDREEAQRIEQIASAVGRHRSWSADVHRAQVAVRTALTAEARDLRAQVARPAIDFSSSYYVQPVMSDHTQALVETADKLVAAGARRHHAHRPAPVRVRLTAAAAELARLERVTDEPVPLRLAVEGPTGIDIWNLLTGAAQRQVSDVHLADGFVPPLRVGRFLLVEPAGKWLLVPADGGRPVRLPPAAQYLAAGDDAIWQVDGSTVRRLDDRGRQIGATHTVPTGYDPPFAASADALLVTHDFAPYSQATPPAAWLPASGRVLPLTGACDASATAGGHVVVYLPCNAAGYVVITDTRTGATRRVRIPTRLPLTTGTLLVSPDGRRVATQLQQPGDPGQASVAVVDVATGHLALLPSPAMPLAWSTDGSVLVVDVNADQGQGFSSEPLAYWQVDSQRLAPIRIPIFDTPVVATLPP